MAKLFASEAGRFCVEECLRIHGGYGYSKEYEIERLYRDAPLLLIGEGTSRDPAHGDRPQAARSATRSRALPPQGTRLSRPCPQPPTPKSLIETAVNAVPRGGAGAAAAQARRGLELRGARRHPDVPRRAARAEGDQGHRRRRQGPPGDPALAVQRAGHQGPHRATGARRSSTATRRRPAIEQILKLIVNVVERQEERSRTRARHGARAGARARAPRRRCSCSLDERQARVPEAGVGEVDADDRAELLGRCASRRRRAARGSAGTNAVALLARSARRPTARAAARRRRRRRSRACR